jgi:non-canonical purine NTP pyrophosphatase (RdgB/HAM1 family)
MLKLLVATGNQGKLKEIRSLLENCAIEIIGLDQLDSPPEVIEDGANFAANAIKKATQMAAFSGLLTLADDSGLVVAALNGEPGVHSARYAGEQGDDAANNAKLLANMANVADEQRLAAFYCVMALAKPDGRCQIFDGKMSGMLMRGERGTGGFGYDPLFMVPEYGKTTAELPFDIKNRISHRGQALRKVVPLLKELAEKENSTLNILDKEQIMERTFAIIKPDAFEAGFAGRILARIYAEGFRVVGLKKLYMSKKEAEGFYAVHSERPFFGELTDFMCSGPSIVMALEAEGAIKKWRDLMGATNPMEAVEGSLRKEFGTAIDRNATHGSDAPETAAFELDYFFSGLELL